MPADFTIPDIMATVNTHRLPYRLADQSGRTWLITGATNGIGREAARAASQAGARVIITARNAERGEALRAELGNAAVLRVDFADLGSIAAGAAALAEPVDVLINNAGTISPARAETVDGHELLIGTNFLGPFAFTNLIMEHVRDRVVIVASGAHRRGRIDRADPQFRRRRYGVTQAYAQSKLADLLWGFELERRLRSSDDPRLSGVDVQLAHPGWALTNLQNATKNRRVNAAITQACTLFAQTAEQGAEPLLFAATEDLPRGSYVGPGGRTELKGTPTLVGRAAAATDRDTARWLWTYAADLTGTDLPAGSS